MDVRFFLPQAKNLQFSSPLPVHMWNSSRDTSLGGGWGRGSVGGQLAWDTETGNKFTVFISRDPQNNWELALSSLASAQLFFAAPEPLLSPSGRLDHLASRWDAMCVDKSLPMLPVNRAVSCTLHLSLNLQSSPRWGSEVVRCAVSVSLIRFQVLVPTSMSNMAAGSLHPASLTPTLFSPWCSAPASLQPAFPRQSILALPSQPQLLPYRYPHRWRNDLILLWLLGKVAKPRSQRHRLKSDVVGPHPGSAVYNPVPLLKGWNHLSASFLCKTGVQTLIQQNARSIWHMIMERSLRERQQLLVTVCR